MIQKLDWTKQIEICPQCGAECKRHSKITRTVPDLGTPQEPKFLQLTTSKHWCTNCKLHFRVNDDSVILPRGRYTNNVIRKAQEIMRDENLTLPDVRDILKDEYSVIIPPSTLWDWENMDGI